MKTKRLFIMIIVLLAVVTTYAQSNMFDKFSNNKNITTVSISKALLSMMPDQMGMGDANIKGLANKLEKLEIYTSQSKDAMNLMKAETDVLAKNKSYESLMSIKEVNNHVVFYAQPTKDKFKSLIMVVNQPDQTVVIRLEGSFTTEDIQNVMNSSGKKK